MRFPFSSRLGRPHRRRIAHSVSFQKIGEIPLPCGGYSLIAKSVAEDGSLLFLSIEPNAINPVTETSPEAKLPEPKRFRLSIVRSGGLVQAIDLPELDVAFPSVDVFPDGKILIVGRRCQWRATEDYDLNGVIFDPKTNRLSRILLGDGIESVFVDTLGRIWVSYFDEGVFGNLGWGHPGPEPIGASGLVCFSQLGEKIWEYPAVNEMADCYALNVSGSEAAIYFYTKFPICKISNNFQLACWETNLRGCQAFAISGTKVFFSGQYNDPSDTAYLGTLKAGGLTNVQQVRLLLPDGSKLPHKPLLGRGRHLYFFDNAGAYSTSLD